jgi:hypothetical protein
MVKMGWSNDHAPGDADCHFTGEGVVGVGGKVVGARRAWVGG